MATSSGQPANVQAYLDKHKISTLFEDLTALLIKDLPANPIDFLIQKLQLKKKRVPSSTRPVSGSTTRKKPDGTGTTAPTKPVGTGRTKTTTTTTTTKTVSTKPVVTKDPVTSRVKPTDSKRPTTGPVTKPSVTKTTGATKKPSAITPTKPTGASRIPSKSPGTSRIPSKSPGTSTTGNARKTGGPLTKKPTSAGSTKPTSIKPRTAIVKKPEPEPEPEPKPEPEPEPEPKPEPEPEPKPEPEPEIIPAPKETKIEQVIKKEEPVEILHDNDDNEDDDEGILISGEEDTAGDDISDSEEEEEDDHDREDTIDLEELLRMKRSKNPSYKQKHQRDHLTVLLEATYECVVISESDSGEGDSDDEGLEVIESIEDLEEEGVILKGDDRRMSLKLPIGGPNVDLKVMLCARCAKVIGRDEEGTQVSSSEVSKLPSIDEFESASQVDSRVSFPQWDSDTVSQLSIKQKWATGAVATCTLSVLSTTSQDTWKGISQPQPLVAPSDEESELKLPAPVDYHKPDDDDVNYDDINDDDFSSSKDTSQDTWKGISQPQPLVAPSDEESELKLPAPVDYHKPDDVDDDDFVTEEGNLIDI